MKNKYRLIINHGTEARKTYTYTYGQTRNIQMHLHSGNALITFTQSSVHQPEMLRTCNDHFCSDAIKKTMLVHLILYAKPLEIRTLQLSVNGQLSDVYIAKDEPLPLVYSMINWELDYPLPAPWKSDAIIETILNSSKSSYDGRHNALIALLIAKSKIYRSEKAMYLWMSMNGLYGALTQSLNETVTEKKKRITKEWQQHDLLCMVSGIGRISENLNPDIRKKLMLDALSILKNCTDEPNQLYNNAKSGEEVNTIGEFRELCSKYHVEMDIYSFLCVWLPYLIRCSYFHTNSAVPLFSYADEPLLKALLYTNYFVEHFVEEHLPEWLTERKLTEAQMEKIHAAYRHFAS